MVNVAREFSTAQNYQTGDLVIFEGVLFKFVSTHSAGAWNQNQVTAVDSNTEQLITLVLGAYNRAVAAVAYAGRVSFSETQISGSRYKYTFLSE